MPRHHRDRVIARSKSLSRFARIRRAPRLLSSHRDGRRRRAADNGDGGGGGGSDSSGGNDDGGGGGGGAGGSTSRTVFEKFVAPRCEQVSRRERTRERSRISGTLPPSIRSICNATSSSRVNRV